MKNEVLEFGLYHNFAEYHDRQVVIWGPTSVGLIAVSPIFAVWHGCLEVMPAKYSDSVSICTEKNLRDEYLLIFTYYLDIIQDNSTAFS